VYIAKRLVIVAPNFAEKSPFLNARLARGALLFPSNEYNNGHPCLRQGLLLVLVPMILYIAKRLIILEKSIFEPMICTRPFVGCVIFPLNEYNDGYPCIWQGLLLELVPMIV
jgi:hypothetical protein